MLISNVQLGYVLTRGGGKLSREVYLAPRPEFQRERIISNFYFHHLLQECLVERVINFISVNLRCILQTFSWVTGVGGRVGGTVQGCLSCPQPRISKKLDNPQILLHHLLQEYLVERDINFISVNLR